MNLEWWQIVLGVIVGLIALMVLVIIHELGHAWFARRNGVEVEEFAIGFPPRAKILGKYKGTLITLNWLLPLGGFCKMKGETDDATEKGSYGAASFWAKTKILFGGVFMNLIAAAVIFTILAWVGMPKILENQFTIQSDTATELSPVLVATVIKGSPAEKVYKSDIPCPEDLPCGVRLDPKSATSIKVDDEILSINGEKVERSSDVPRLTKKYAGHWAFIVIKTNGKKESVVTELNAKNEGKGYLGISTSQSEKFRATWSAPIVGVVTTFQFIWETIAGIGGMIGNLFGGLWGLITGGGADAQQQISSVGEQVAGPVGILGVIFPAMVAAGLTELLFLIGLISLTLTVMNILPIPGLDGGRWYLTAGFKLFGKKLTKKKEETIVGTGMLILFGLVILITISDIWKLF
ncbi:M50 family metallopeptidase [Candidatus Saccharibacteria bacterium]|nr:M50 family metallopeptidase [Candidatus Saccharibacteria bacterium]MCL1962778.1 M50 family metallopeptidase [Candidatus Saccharibacteria bacterium]